MQTLRGIDVSGWQPDIEPSTIDCDFVIVKATGGTGYTNPFFMEQANKALNAGKLLGVYHFAGDGMGGSAQAEARHFLDAFAPFKGRAIPILDWEADATSWPIQWAKTWLDTVARETGAVPWFYSYASYVQNHDCREIERYPLWLAAYYAGYAPMGWQANPPRYGGAGSWSAPVCYQYTSTGRVGYRNSLDLNIFYGSREDFERYYKEVDDVSDAYDYLTAKTDESGRGKNADMRTRLAFMAAKQEKMQGELDSMSKKLDKLIKKLGA